VSNDGIEVEPLRDEVRCTPFSVSSVQLHEVSDPFTMVEPGVIVDLTNAVDFHLQMRSGLQVWSSKLHDYLCSLLFLLFKALSLTEPAH